MLYNVKDFDVECQCVLVQLRDALKMGCHASATVTKKLGSGYRDEVGATT
jgi:hypothetical protein